MLDALLPGGPASLNGKAHLVRGATNLPPALQAPRPPIFVGGKGDRLLRLVAEMADGWNTCWVWTPDDYRGRLDVLDRACEEIGRDPASVRRTLGLYALAGEDERDLAARYERMQASAPGGMLDKVPLEEWRVGRLVGTAGPAGGAGGGLGGAGRGGAHRVGRARCRSRSAASRTSSCWPGRSVPPEPRRRWERRAVTWVESIGGIRP